MMTKEGLNKVWTTIYFQERLTLAEKNERLQSQLRSLKEDLAHTRDDQVMIVSLQFQFVHVLGEFEYDFVFTRRRRRWTRSTRRMWSRAGTSTRPCGRWGKATQRGGWTSLRTCKCWGQPTISGTVESCPFNFLLWPISNPPRLLSLRVIARECYKWTNPRKKSKKTKPSQELQSTWLCPAK